MPGMEQDEIDKLLAEALGDADAEELPLPQTEDEGEQQEPAAPESPPAQAPPASEAPAAEAPPAADTPPTPPADDEAASELRSQDDVDALLSDLDASDDDGAAADADAEKTGADAGPGEAEDAAIAENRQPDDIDALLSDMVGDAEQATTPDAEAARPPGESGGEDAPTPAEEEHAPEAVSQQELDALIREGDPESEEPTTRPESEDAVRSMGKTTDGEERLAEEPAPVEVDAASAIIAEQVVTPPPAPEAQQAASGGETKIMAMPETGDGEEAAAAEPPPPQPVPPPQPPPLQDVQGIQESLSLMTSAGEVEGLAGQIASLLGQLSERARRFQNAWLQSDQETKNLRTLQLAAERRLEVMGEEKRALQEEVDTLRSRLSKVEGERLASEESARTQVSSLELKLREQISRADMLATEVEALKEELGRARNESTGADLESRRARFELDRARNELDAERMERMRLQRALDNREKELQAVQAQTSGQASSLFLDELHRLVRRLENELDLRTGAAHEALAVLDRLQVPDELVAAKSNLRVALTTAAGLTQADEEDALRSLTRAAGKPGDAVSPIRPYDGKASLAAFESALVNLDADAARDLARELLRSTYTTPAHLMSKVYTCPALRLPEVGKHLGSVIKLLQELKQAQEAADSNLGREGPDTERMMVQMFDYLHNLARLKLITRTTAEAWGFFLELRSRYSFVTSDKQWADYRDRVLSS